MAISKSGRLRCLLWLDCTAAGVAGLAMLAASGVLAPWFGVPRALLVGTALANLGYGAFSYSLARMTAPPRARVRALVAGNFAWTAVCWTLAAVVAGPGSWLGMTYLLAEGAVVGGLAAVEARALATAP